MQVGLARPLHGDGPPCTRLAACDLASSQQRIFRPGDHEMKALLVLTTVALGAPLSLQGEIASSAATPRGRPAATPSVSLDARRTIDATVVSAEYAATGGLRVVIDRGSRAGVQTGSRGFVYLTAARQRVLRSPTTGAPVELRVVQAAKGTARARVAAAGLTLEQLRRSPHVRLTAAPAGWRRGKPLGKSATGESRVVLIR